MQPKKPLLKKRKRRRKQKRRPRSQIGGKLGRKNGNEISNKLVDGNSSRRKPRLVGVNKGRLLRQRRKMSGDLGWELLHQHLPLLLQEFVLPLEPIDLQVLVEMDRLPRHRRPFRSPLVRRSPVPQDLRSSEELGLEAGEIAWLLRRVPAGPLPMEGTVRCQAAPSLAPPSLSRTRMASRPSLLKPEPGSRSGGRVSNWANLEATCRLLSYLGFSSLRIFVAFFSVVS